MKHDPQIQQALIELLGTDTYRPDGSLNRAYIANHIFNNSNLLTKINQIVHPAVRKDYERWHQENVSQVGYTIQESALLFETGSYHFFDHVILVDAPLKLRIRRVMQRDQLSRKEVLARISKQMPAQEKRKMASMLLKNNGKRPILRQIFDLHHRFLNELNSSLLISQ